MDHQALSDYAAIATIVTGFTAVTALLLVWWQTGRFRKQQIESVARDHYQTFLRLCIEYPEFAVPRTAQLDVAKGTFKGEEPRFVSYLWFVWSGLNALESMYFALGSKESWRNTIASILDEHHLILRSDYVRKYANTFEPDFHRFIGKWMYPSGSGT